MTANHVEHGIATFPGITEAGREMGDGDMNDNVREISR